MGADPTIAAFTARYRWTTAHARLLAGSCAEAARYFRELAASGDQAAGRWLEFAEARAGGDRMAAPPDFTGYPPFLLEERFRQLGEGGWRPATPGDLDTALPVLATLPGRVSCAVATFELESGYPDQARRCLEQVLAAPDADVKTRCRACNVLLRLGAFERALEVALELEAAHPEHAEAVRIRGFTCLADRRLAEAAACFTRLKALQPDEVANWPLSALAALAADDLDGAERDVRRAFALRRTPMALTVAGLLELARGRPAEAVVLQEEARAAGGDSAMFLANLAVCLAAAERWPEALRHYQMLRARFSVDLPVLRRLRPSLESWTAALEARPGADGSP